MSVRIIFTKRLWLLLLILGIGCLSNTYHGTSSWDLNRSSGNNSYYYFTLIFHSLWIIIPALVYGLLVALGYRTNFYVSVIHVLFFATIWVGSYTSHNYWIFSLIPVSWGIFLGNVMFSLTSGRNRSLMQ